MKTSTWSEIATASNCTWQRQLERREPWCIAFFCSRSHTRLLFAPPGAGMRRGRKWTNWWWSLSPSNWFFLKTDVIGYLKNVTTTTNQLLNQPIWVFSVLNDVKWIEMLSITGCSPDQLFTQLFQALLKGIWVLASLAMNKSSRLSWKFWIPKMQGQK